MKIMKVLENLPCEEGPKQLGILPWRRCGEAQHTVPVLKGQLQRGRAPSLHKQPPGEDKGRRVQAALGEGLAPRTTFFHSKNNCSPEEPPLGRGRVPIAGGFSRWGLNYRVMGLI